MNNKSQERQGKTKIRTNPMLSWEGCLPEVDIWIAGIQADGKVVATMVEGLQPPPRKAASLVSCKTLPVWHLVTSSGYHTLYDRVLRLRRCFSLPAHTMLGQKHAELVEILEKEPDKWMTAKKLNTLHIQQKNSCFKKRDLFQTSMLIAVIATQPRAAAGFRFYSPAFTGAGNPQPPQEPSPKA
eukprot:781390-Amphidinium_carterae.1